MLPLLIALTTITTPASPEVERVLREAVHSARRAWPEEDVTAVASAVLHSGIDPALVLGVMRTESGFHRRARSGRGALGLLQMMPTTAAAFAARAGVTWRGPETLADPVANVCIGTAYLHHLLSRFDGDVSLALAAYAHGPTKIRRALRRRGALSWRAGGYARAVQAHRARFAVRLTLGAPAHVARAWSDADPLGANEPPVQTLDARLVLVSPTSWSSVRVPTPDASRPAELTLRSPETRAVHLLRRGRPRSHRVGGHKEPWPTRPPRWPPVSALHRQRRRAMRDESRASRSPTKPTRLRVGRRDYRQQTPPSMPKFTSAIGADPLAHR